MPTRLGINGFGRIGRQVFTALLKKPEIQTVAVNDITDAATLAHLLKYDSNYGRFPYRVEVKGSQILVDGHPIQVLSIREPEHIPWGDLGIHLVVESTGLFTKKEKANKHLRDSVERVVITAPSSDADATLVMGVNHTRYDPNRHRVISNASCTTNCLAPVAKVLNDAFTIQSGVMTTVHAFTNDQRVLDLPHRDLRRARAASLSIIPTTTGAASAIGQVIPELAGKLNGIALRIPTSVVSLVDLVVEVQKPTSVAEVNHLFQQKAAGDLKGILGYTEEPLVSVDFKGDPHSAVVDGLSTMVVGERTVKVIAWYDNEMAYAMRVADLAEYILQPDHPR